MNRVLLEEHFKPDQIKDRQTIHGTLSYIEAAAVIQRLNDSFQGEWSFDISTEDIGTREVRVRGKLTAAGESKTQYGKSDITFDGDMLPVSIADDLKAAASDCLKKCATLFGVGLHLYLPGAREPFENPAPKPQASPYPLPVPRSAQSYPGSHTQPVSSPVGGRPEEDNDGNRISSKQLKAIFGIALGSGWKQQEIKEYAKDRFGKMPDFLTKREASTFIDYLKGTR